MKHTCLRSITTLGVLAAALVAIPTASAQPGAEPPPDYPGAEPAPPEGPPESEPPFQEPPQPRQPRQPRTIQMTPDERELVLRGEIDQNLYIGGALIGTFLAPFGIGQAVQGRWSDRGWIFTVGEAASIGVIIAGISRFDSSTDDGEGLLIAGVLGLVGFRIWEMVDLWVGPPLHNQKVQRVYMKYGIPPGSQFYGAAPYVAPTGRGGAIAGFTFRL